MTIIFLTNSFLHSSAIFFSFLQDHPWHIYASSTGKRQSSGSNSAGRQKSVYLASTRSACGRPTKAIMSKILLCMASYYNSS